jgi:hypothetical protein
MERRSDASSSSACYKLQNLKTLQICSGSVFKRRPAWFVFIVFLCENNGTKTFISAFQHSLVISGPAGNSNVRQIDTGEKKADTSQFPNHQHIVNEKQSNYI